MATSIEVDFTNGVVRAAPIAAGAGAEVASQVAGMTLSDWFYAAVIVYTIVQTIVLVFKTVMDEKRKNKGGPT
ncbi:holin [Pseudomonas phage PPPL-1]|uniref:Holin n=4 Tax=Studiervirinae TaxID=2731653 RepID=A0A6M3T8N9_9CAUD|nr:holin [Pseudomonas phage PPPL-1]ALO80005.1 type II holin [Pseudomonas phage PPPL-1]QJD54637.1 putative type II holin [Pseudomonas phage MR1]UMO76119.1 class II holin [Pseudomonas phage P413]